MEEFVSSSSQFSSDSGATPSDGSSQGDRETVLMLVIGSRRGILRKADDEMFALTPIDDFEVEVELLKRNVEFMAFLKQLAQEKATISLKSLRAELGL